jgi:predicted nucleic acid-binding protein
VPAITPGRTAIVDANVLINLIHVQRLGLLASLPGYEFVATGDVISEITHPAQRSALDAALSAGQLRWETITDPHDLTRYAELRQVMGAGEAACVALAEARGWLIASDEKGRLRREVNERLGPGRLITTPGLFVLAIRAGVITVEDADQAKAILEGHRFRMSFSSFRDVVGSP